MPLTRNDSARSIGTGLLPLVQGLWMLALALPAGAQEPPPKDAPWSLEEAVGAPDWLSLEGHLRIRYESFDEQFRAGLSGSGHGLFTRAALRATARHGDYRGTLELMDARQFDTPSDVPLSASQVNALDVLQAHVGVLLDDVWAEDDELDVVLGRHTMDIGSRRLVARNRFRNTVNSFTGLNATYDNGLGAVLRAFYTIPVNKLPNDRDSIRDNEQEWDEERSQVRFFGIHGARKELFGPVNAELYLFGLEEEDGDDLSTKDRDLWTAGTRLVKPPEAGEFDFELEAVVQTGESRSSSSDANTTDLDHQAELFHLSVGYRWEGPSATRLEFLFDYASGDEDPNDGDWNRFDSLYGVPHFEWGPTGIFRAFTRENMISPGLRLRTQLTDSASLMIADRFNYLASDRDAWTTSGLVDPTGQSGDYVGNLAEARVRWKADPNVQFDLGVAHLFAGEFIDDAPNATTQGDSTFVYLGTTLSF